ncbi:hypothetical protein BGW80DRAFT_1321592 [Lactifluus volemus]|nr:hypothetical protein BGW80DRAFT_1321592 [Lactifluus volemus]
MYFKIGDASEHSSGRVHVLCSVSYPYAAVLIHKYFSLAHFYVSLTRHCPPILLPYQFLLLQFFFLDLYCPVVMCFLCL